MTARQSAETICEIAKIAREMFGGFASEGGFDYLADGLDYVLYTSYNLYGKQHPLCDETIPFWQLVYHGSILYNPSTETVNFCAKDAKSHLKYIEYGGRPLGYFNSKYVGEGGCGNWMGEEDLLCASEEELADSIDGLAGMYREYQSLWKLQLEYMLRHDKIRDGVYQTAYSDGTTLRSTITPAAIRSITTAAAIQLIAAPAAIRSNEPAENHRRAGAFVPAALGDPMPGQ